MTAAAAAPSRPAPQGTSTDVAPRVRLPVAPLVRALVATLVDGALAGGLAFAASSALVPLLLSAPPPKTEGLFGLLELVLMSPIVLLVFAALALTLSMALHMLTVPATGRTVGGLLTGVHLVVRATGAAPGVGRAGLRGLMSALGGLLLLTGPLWALWIDPLRRGLGDVVSGTLPVTKGGAL